MTQVKGVTTMKNPADDITYVTIGIMKHKEALPVLKQIGRLEKT